MEKQFLLTESSDHVPEKDSQAPEISIKGLFREDLTDKMNPIFGNLMMGQRNPETSHIVSYFIQNYFDKVKLNQNQIYSLWLYCMRWIKQSTRGNI